MDHIHHSSIVRIGLALVVLAAAVGWSSGGAVGSRAMKAEQGPYELTFTGSGFDPHDGDTLHAALIDAATGAVVVRALTIVAHGSFTIRWPAILQPGHSYRVDYYADVNNNGRCDGPPIDHMWSVAVPAFSGRTRVAVTHNTDFDVQACAKF